MERTVIETFDRCGQPIFLVPRANLRYQTELFRDDLIPVLLERELCQLQ
jgi:hypothetical protein